MLIKIGSWMAIGGVAANLLFAFFDVGWKYQQFALSFLPLGIFCLIVGSLLKNKRRMSLSGK